MSLGKPQKIQMGTLDVVEVPNTQENVPKVVLFHGYGADCSDLVPLCQHISGGQEFHWYFPDAPDMTPFGGRQWFPVDMEAIERASRSGTHRDLTLAEPPGLERARSMASEMIAELQTPWSQLILGGFSQGAMMATDQTLQSSENPKGLVIFSGTLLDKDNWKTLASQKKGIPTLQSHGTQDPILNFQDAVKLGQILDQSQWRRTWIEFQGGHEIPPTVLQKFDSFLKKLL